MTGPLAARWSDECGRDRAGTLRCKVWPACADCPLRDLEDDGDPAKCSDPGCESCRAEDE
jgi:hypothetical protein